MAKLNITVKQKDNPNEYMRQLRAIKRRENPLLPPEGLPSRKIKDIRGERFGRLFVESFSHLANNKGRNAHWSCQCDCGNKHTVSSESLRTGTCISCGCYASELSKVSIKKTHTKGDHLYFIRSGPYVKIGRSNNITKRLSSLKSMNPHGVHLVHYVENGGHLEHSLHERFKDSHHSGEWFLLDDEEVCEIVAIGNVE